MISLLFALLVSVHPIHISITEIDHNEKSKSLQLTLRIFIDDLELSIRSQNNQPELDLLNPGPGKTTDELVKDYLRERLTLKVDKKVILINYLGHEIEGPALICYLEGEHVKKFVTVEVSNSVIFETHSDQSNLVNVNYGGKVKSLRLTSEKSTGRVTFPEK